MAESHLDFAETEFVFDASKSHNFVHGEKSFLAVLKAMTLL